jgi:hypothetical protein
MDDLISCFVGLKCSARQSLAGLGIVMGLVTLVVPAATQAPPQLAAQLTICKVKNASDSFDVKFRASVHWLDVPRTNWVTTLYIGALNPNGELWPQVTSGPIVWGGDTQIDFVVSRQSTFPTRFALFGLNQSAQETLANYRRSGRYYLRWPSDEIALLSNEITVNYFDEVVTLC